ncbi:MAG: aminotransferase class V-fold PLP-dependent enzyme [Gammaproteobacteria bacterium]
MHRTRRDVGRAAIGAFLAAAFEAVPDRVARGAADAPGRLPVFSFVLNDRAPQEILRRLDENGVAIRAGDLSALPLLKRLGVTAAARASCYLYTRTEDIDRLVDALGQLGARRRARA